MWKKRKLYENSHSTLVESAIGLVHIFIAAVLYFLFVIADMDWPELEQNMALWQICLTGHMQVCLFLNSFQFTWHVAV